MIIIIDIDTIHPLTEEQTKAVEGEINTCCSNLEQLKLGFINFKMKEED